MEPEQRQRPIVHEPNGKFAKGNKAGRGGARPGAGRKPNKFKEQIKPYSDLANAKLKGRLNSIIYGTAEGAKPADSIRLLGLLWAYTNGLPISHSVNENINTDVKAFSKEDLMKRINQLMGKDEKKPDERERTTPDSGGTPTA